jgi:nucleotide-binding universal stress UspA family protein
MQMADRDLIILPTDFSTVSLAAVKWAHRMASVLDAELHAVFVLEEPHIYGTLEMGPLPVPTSDELKGSAQTRLEKFVGKHLGDLEGPVVRKVLVGQPADEIVQYASDVGASMIVMSLHGYTGVRHLVLGSTTESVLRRAACPVLSIRAE